ncbi:MAG: ribosome-binding factor A [Candidatus Abawacabacteria bacterium RBG_16_42_10]|uniref:Ribosome-binding factor A n=1 Tax=Candidatus Abawacabacteria bacterium RBG_16_42_10 TaxID=1817814 RepID=A0A1F4XIT5_9BACT|nr:MAG: ribosome-binding factor A [Candidatus Abawacabacteria bacterium RBG_16_42_10]
MPESRRLVQINQVLKEYIGRFLEQEFHEPEIGLLTVTRVEVTPDLAEAKVWVSSYVSSKSPQLILKKLRHKSRNIHLALREVLTTKRIPKVNFLIDETAAYVDHIEELLKKAQRKPGLDNRA